ncbi:ATPase SWSAP1 [Toxotes jaculatrix]|uniref:ATPase SWSAP1 n=1 Tax=Toxotes jaculatrix TaxID=941984 RepID=UPI001B3ACC46|nr:ATPase SWSAP1 [Toxotes jaculatrix]XP_040919256.1 ATPase SWSAP1 [Toxotes jaculatrix]XP_040919257.1 ATPase SWSAP1 [Toxotes jaculatrix]
MADILTRVFRTFTSPADLKTDLTVSPPPTTCSSLLVGDHSVSRSVLLLTAVTAASQMGMKVMFFTQTQIQSLPLSLQNCVPSLSPETLKKIKFSYPRTLEDLLQQMASLHEPTNTSPTPPSLIIVDRLDSFLCGVRGGSHSGFHPGEQSSAAHLSALLCDTAAFLTQVLEQRSSTSGPCRVIASFQSEADTGQAGGEPPASDPILDVLDRYFQVRCTLDQDTGHEPASAGLQQVWHIYLSGRGITEAARTKDCEDRPGEAHEWQLLIFPNGLMEFKLV